MRSEMFLVFLLLGAIMSTGCTDKDIQKNETESNITIIPDESVTPEKCAKLNGKIMDTSKGEDCVGNDVKIGDVSGLDGGPYICCISLGGCGI